MKKPFLSKPYGVALNIFLICFAIAFDRATAMSFPNLLIIIAYSTIHIRGNILAEFINILETFPVKVDCTRNKFNVFWKV